MTKLVWPIQVASLAKDVNTKVLKFSGPYRTGWVLSIAGPFCFFPYQSQKSPSYHARIRTAEDSVSGLLALPVSRWCCEQAVMIQVGFDATTWQRIFNNEYLKDTEQTS